MALGKQRKTSDPTIGGSPGSGDHLQAPGPGGFQVFSEPTAEDRFGRAGVQRPGCPPAAGSGQPPSSRRKVCVASRRTSAASARPASFDTE